MLGDVKSSCNPTTFHNNGSQCTHVHTFVLSQEKLKFGRKPQGICRSTQALHVTTVSTDLCTSLCLSTAGLFGMTGVHFGFVQQDDLFPVNAL